MKKQIPFSRSIGNKLRAVVQCWGFSGAKRSIWNREFAEGRWDHIEKTAGDCVYSVVERHCRKGSILDLGCGSGNTGTELNPGAYRDYTGVDISDVAIRKASERSRKDGRSGQNRYLQSDIMSFRPDGRYEVILFRESLFYIPTSKIRSVLQRYSAALKEDGVFVVRMCDRVGYARLVDIIEKNFSVLERVLPEDGKTIVLVFR